MSENTAQNDPVLAGAYAIVLAGGSGTRLWPLSRNLLPKQLLALDGARTLVQQTMERVGRVFDADKTWVVTNEEHVFEVRGQIREIDPELDRRTLSEPIGRNTLPAILMALDKIAAEDPAAICAVFPSDHLVGRPEGFAASLAQAAGLARDGWFVTFGIVPAKPETGYGYIRRGRELAPDCYEVQGFTEKPDLATAKQYLAGGDYFWNSGMFVFRADVFLAAAAAHAPEIWAWWEGRGGAPLREGYALIPDVSVDYGIIEKMDRLAMVKAAFDWDDLGSWEAVYRLGAKDENACSVRGDVLPLDCHGSLLISEGGKLAAVGLTGMIVIQTRDATLVCPIDQVQKVKDVVNSLKAQGSSLVEAHVTVRRPWGSYTVLEDGPHFKIKRIMVPPGGRLSLQKHHHRTEHWVVISGTAQVQVGDKEMLLVENQSVDIPKTAVHRLSNPGKVPVEIIEVQTGPYLEEDDIVRFDDVYGRTTK
ncbi:MAG: mannose-1-phosphate guanylyltransferase/mannose-6-phosphate isomerase [Desulfovibrionaceae bacterium]|nr:mannose-1-phosphate guanylyltransferase/mannose-6-phosphate isomerase [Desulfovibrionaceae bacterium]MBF0514128.1 mannose-1-phosphate guanylyltransferase/mannose-6-phosphate isomerase [Desulfovibrionaceae bacterium]